jgi:putative transposase
MLSRWKKEYQEDREHAFPGKGRMMPEELELHQLKKRIARLMREAGIRLSLGSTGDCYDNAAMGSFFSTLKSELVNREKLKTEEEARRKIFDYIEVYYNRQRRHSTLNYQTPAEHGYAAIHP